MTKEELGAVNNLTRQIQAESSRLEYLKDCVKRITRELDGLPRSDTGYKKSSVEELTAQIIDCQNKLNNLCRQRAESRAGLIGKLNSAVDDDTRRRILIERYVFGKYFRDIAKKVYLSKSRVFAIHRQALRALGINGRVNLDSLTTAI